jgi:hypothetical protein
MNKKTSKKIQAMLKKTKKFFSGGWVAAGAVGTAAVMGAASLYTAGMTDLLVVGGKALLLYSGMRVIGNTAALAGEDALEAIGYKPPDPNVKLLPPAKKKKEEIVFVSEEEEEEDG